MSEPGEWLTVESLDLEGQGVAHDANGKVVFVEGALAGETVQVEIRRRKPQWERGTMAARQRDSAQRVVPRCPHFGRCGGCRLQHLHVGAQVATKQRALEDALWHVGKVKPERVLRPIEGPAWRYRHRARLAVRHVIKKGGVLVGFHEAQSSYVADMDSCEVVPEHVSRLIAPLRVLIATMEARDRLPQIELAVGDAQTVLVLRHLEPLSRGDLARLHAFAEQHGIAWWLQPKGPDTAHPLDGGGDLAYALPEFGLRLPFRPTDFTQVNHAVNEVLVARAVQLLALRPVDRVIDWFCGLGNFTLPIATRAASVLGVEGSEALLERARAAAGSNGLTARTDFRARNLFELDASALASFGKADRWLVDPPREGAFALVKALVELAADAPAHGWAPPERIVYVSCNPATLARDAGLLVHRGAYRCVAAGAVNMFPHTAHVESIALFVQGDGP
ncbi:MAG TPA: 23S rRNA (uracil(1939)-C(5))-methyltransferase RlmD [Caldimonas sp.]|nr:23S rRNA (uracil(1939)-C(5))-methyltransferase RlmD [Caldimonas sp.]